VLLHHNDVLGLTVALLEEPKFRLLLTDRFPVLLIDEYQDTDDAFAGAVLSTLSPLAPARWSVSSETIGKRFTARVCGQIEHPSLEVIGKESTSARFGNRQRAQSNASGTSTGRHDAGGSRRRDGLSHQRMARPARDGGHSRGDLPPIVSHEYLGQVKRCSQKTDGISRHSSRRF